MDLDPNSLIDITKVDSQSLHHSSGVYIGGGIILTVAHVAYLITDTLNEGFEPNSVFYFKFGSGLSDAPDYSIQINGDRAGDRFINGRDRFHGFHSPTISADIAVVDLSRGGPINSGDAAFMRSIQGPSMVIFSNPNDADGLNISLFGYPGITKDGTTLCQSNGVITGHGSTLASLAGETLMTFSASISSEDGFSGGPVFATLDPDGDGISSNYLLALDTRRRDHLASHRRRGIL